MWFMRGMTSSAKRCTAFDPASGLAAEQTAYPSDAIEMALAHTIATRSRPHTAAAIYLRSANG